MICCNLFLVQTCLQFIDVVKYPMCVLNPFSCTQLFSTLWTVARQVFLSLGLSRQEHWSELPCPPPGDLLNPGFEPKSLKSPAFVGEFGLPCGSAGKESTCNAGDLGLIPGLGRFPGERKGYPLQYSGLENFMDCIAHGVSKSRTRLSDFHFTSLHFFTTSAAWEAWNILQEAGNPALSSLSRLFRHCPYWILIACCIAHPPPLGC